MTPKTKARFVAARKSRTVWLSAAIPVLVAITAAAQEALPGLKDLLGPWVYFGASVAISGAVAVLRVRSVPDAPFEIKGGE